MNKTLANMKLETWLKMINLGDGNLIAQSKRADMTYGHIRNIYVYFEECGIVHMEKIGRQYKIRLTEKGEALQKLFNKIKEELADINAEAIKLGKIRNKKNV